VYRERLLVAEKIAKAAAFKKAADVLLPRWDRK
jgi:hypothetical protein